MLGLRVVHGDDGVAKCTFCRHGLQANYSGGGLLGAADDGGELLGEARMQRGVEVGAVVHDDLGVGGEHRVDMAVVRLGVLTRDGVDVDAVILDERGGGVVLCGQRV